MATRDDLELEAGALVQVDPDPKANGDVGRALAGREDRSGLTDLQVRVFSSWVELGEERTRKGRRRTPTLRQAARHAGIPPRVVDDWMADPHFSIKVRDLMDRRVNAMVPLVHHRLGEAAMDGDVAAAKTFLQLHDPEAFARSKEAAEITSLYRFGSRKRVRVIDAEVVHKPEEPDA